MQNIMADPLPLNKIKLPLSFVANNGQEGSKAHFTTSLNKRRIFFSSDRITLVELEAIEESIPEPEDFPVPIEEPDEPRNGVALELSFINANASLAPEGISQLPGHHHFYQGNDSTKWNNGVPHYKELRYPGVWDGVDLELSGSKGDLKMNWVLDTPERVSSIRLHWAGANSLEIDSTGNLLVHHALGALTDLAPIAYQEIEGERKPVDCVYRLYGSFDLGFELTGSYLENLPLIVDPIIRYSTYLGGGLTARGRDITVDTQGCAYVTGSTNSVDFPNTPGAFQTTNRGRINAYVTKFSSDGTSLIYSTYLGGSGEDHGFSISLDTQDCAYITGQSGSNDFPITPGAFQSTRGTMFVTKLAADGGSLIYSTYLGYSGMGSGITVDPQGHAHVTGITYSDDFPTTPGAFQTTKPAFVGSAFITKFSTDGGSLIYSTYLGGNSQGNSIALDTQNHAYVTGYTSSSEFPVTPGAFQTTYTRPSAFVTKLALDGSALIYSTFLSGTSNSSFGVSISIDSLGYAYITGRVTGAGFPVTSDAFQTVYGGGSEDTFVSKLSPGGNSLIASTYLGGSASDRNYGGSIDMQGQVYVTGYTTSPNFPITPDVIPSVPQTSTNNIYISIFSTDLTKLLVSYRLTSIVGYGIANGLEGAVYVTGSTSSTDFFTTPGAYQTTLTGTRDAYVIKTGFAFHRQASVELEGIF